MTCCVYKHTVPNGKVYIGITRNDAKDIEAKLIAQYKSYIREYGYNVQRGIEYGYVERLHITKEEYKRKQKEMCNTVEYRTKCKERCKTNKEIYQYDMNGNFIAKYFSRKEAERTTGISQYGIKTCVNGEKKSYKGFIWSYTPPRPN